MKKFIALIIIAATFAGLYAQDATTVVLLQYNTVKKKVDANDEDIKDPKKSIKATTWFKRGELYQDVFMLGLEQLYEGMDATTLKLFYKEPNSIESEEKDGQLIEKYKYDHMIYILVNGLFQEWERVDPIVKDPLRVAIDAYIKALELDEKGKLTDKIKENFIELKTQLKRDGVNYYYGDSYDKALEFI